MAASPPDEAEEGMVGGDGDDDEEEESVTSQAAKGTPLVVKLLDAPVGDLPTVVSSEFNSFPGPKEHFSPFETVITQRVRHATLEICEVAPKQLHRQLLSDGSDFLPRYHEGRGDMKLEMTPWGFHGTSHMAHRNATWETVVKVPQKKQVQVFEDQMVCFLSVNGAEHLVVHFVSRTPKVPFGESFRVETVMHIRQDGTLCHVDLHSYVHFIKSTMMKKKIQDTAAQELQNSHSTMVAMVEQQMGQYRETVRLRRRERDEKRMWKRKQARQARRSRVKSVVFAVDESAGDVQAEGGAPSESLSGGLEEATVEAVSAPEAPTLQAALEEAVRNLGSGGAGFTNPDAIQQGAVAKGSFLSPPHCNVQSCFEALFGTTAFLLEYHQQRGDIDLKLGDWSSGEGGQHRRVSWETVVRVPQKKQVEVLEAQVGCIARVQGQLMGVVHFASQTPKVPFGETFRVETLLVLRADIVDGAPVTRGDLYGYIHFVKSTMMKKKIQDTASKELQTSSVGFSDLATKHLAAARKHVQRRSRKVSMAAVAAVRDVFLAEEPPPLADDTTVPTSPDTPDAIPRRPSLIPPTGDTHEDVGEPRLQVGFGGSVSVTLQQAASMLQRESHFTPMDDVVQHHTHFAGLELKGIDVDIVFELFFSGCAFLTDHQEQVGSTAVDIPPWVHLTGRWAGQRLATYHTKKGISAVEQHLYCFCHVQQTDRLVVRWSTQFPDVSCGDCFRVETLVDVRPLEGAAARGGDGGGGGGVKVCVLSRVTFIKSATFHKKKILSTAEGDLRLHNDTLVKNMHRAADEWGKKREQEEVAKQRQKKQRVLSMMFTGAAVPLGWTERDGDGDKEPPGDGGLTAQSVSGKPDGWLWNAAAEHAGSPPSVILIADQLSRQVNRSMVDERHVTLLVSLVGSHFNSIPVLRALLNLLQTMCSTYDNCCVCVRTPELLPTLRSAVTRHHDDDGLGNGSGLVAALEQHKLGLLTPWESALLRVFALDDTIVNVFPCRLQPSTSESDKREVGGGDVPLGTLFAARHWLCYADIKTDQLLNPSELHPMGGGCVCRWGDVTAVELLDPHTVEVVASGDRKFTFTNFPLATATTALHCLAPLRHGVPVLPIQLPRVTSIGSDNSSSVLNSSLGSFSASTSTLQRDRTPSRGVLRKKGKGLTGYKARDFELVGHGLKYSGGTSVGEIDLRGAVVEVEGTTGFTVTGPHTQRRYHLKARTEGECRQWVEELKLAAAGGAEGGT